MTPQPAPASTRDIAIRSDGLSTDTSITVDGTPVDNVMRVDWSVSSGDVAQATVYCEVFPADVKASAWQFLPTKETPFRARLALAWMVLRGER